MNEKITLSRTIEFIQGGSAVAQVPYQMYISVT